MSATNEAVPASWQWVTMENLVGSEAPIIYGIIQAGPEVQDGVPYIRPTELVDDAIDIAALKRTSVDIARRYDRARLAAGDIVLAIVGTIGKLAIVPRELAGANITQSSARIRPPTWMQPRFLAHVLKSPQMRAQFDAVEFGIGVRRLNIAHVRALQVAVPPLPELRRIVAKLDALQSRSRRAKDALDAIPPLLERFRQSVLAAAFRGDLTAAWRAKNPDVEPASELLKRIRVERRAKWEEAESAKRAKTAKGAKGIGLGDNGWRGKYQEPEAVDASGLPELPAGWCWANLGELADRITDGTHQPPPTVESGIPFIGIRNVIGGVIDWDTVDKWVSPETHAALTERCPPEIGDVLYTAVGATFGRAVTIESDRPFVFQRHIAHIKLLRGYVGAKFVGAALNSPLVFSQACRVARGAAQPTVTLGDLSRLALPIPPALEQNAILDRVERMLRFRDAAEVQILGCAERTAGLDSALLAKAFRGELVAQDPSDEPASALLARLGGAGEERRDSTRRHGGHGVKK